MMSFNFTTKYMMLDLSHGIKTQIYKNNELKYLGNFFFILYKWT